MYSSQVASVRVAGTGVCKQWTGLLDWNTELEYWSGLLDCTEHSQKLCIYIYE